MVSLVIKNAGEQEKEETLQANDLIAEPREPVELPRRAAKSDSVSDSYTPERT